MNEGNEVITLANYTSKIQTPITNYLSSHGGINFIVLTKGILTIIDNGATGSENQGTSPNDYQPSLDSYLAAMGYSTANGNVKATIVGSGAQGVAWVNKYYNSTVPFTHAAFGGYLVTRLDGYTQTNAVALVDHALTAEQNHGSGGPVLLDVDSDFGLGDKTAMPPTTPSTNVTVEENFDNGNADFLHAADVLQASGISNYTVITNKDVGAQTNLLGFFSWGCNGNFDPSKYEALYFAPGSIANTFVSSSMHSFICQDVGFTNVNLTGMTNFNARIANGNNDTHYYYFAIRLDSPSGPIIGTCSAPYTGGWQTWMTVSCPLISGLSGVHSIYLVFLRNGFGGDLYNIEWISFNKGNPTNVIAVSSYSTLSGDAFLETCSEGGQDLGSIPDGQSRMGDLIANGLTGAEGNVNEPTLNASVGNAFIIKNYEMGYTLAESFYAGLPYVGWEETVVGDPLCCPYLNAGNNIITPTQASSYNGSAGGVDTEDCSEGDLDVGQISNGSYTFYSNINLTGATSFVARVANPNTAATIQIRLDSSTGTLIGTCPVPVTGDWQVWTTTSCSVTNATGTHAVYLVYSGGFNIQWFGFKSGQQSSVSLPINFDAAGMAGFGGTNYSGQGAYSDTGHNYWNALVFGGTTPAGINSDGTTASPITLTDTSSGRYNGGQGANGTPAGLESPFTDNSNNGSIVTNKLNNVPAGTYNLYLYGKNDDNGDANRGTTFKVSVGGTSYGSLSTTNSTTSSFTKGNDYVEFTNIVVGSGGVITFTYAANTAATNTFNPQNEGNFNGLQLVPAPTTVTVINFDVPGGVSGSVNYSGQGAYSDAGHNYWNAVVTTSPYTTSGGLLSDGTTASSITLTATYGAGGGGVYTGDPQGANGTPSGLFAPFEDNKTSASNTNTLNNVPAGTYSLYLYGDNADDADRGTTFTVWTASTSATSLSTVNLLADANTFVKGVNYVVFTNLVLTSTGTINIKWTANTAATDTFNPQTEGMFNGLQLVSGANGNQPQLVLAPQTSTSVPLSIQSFSAAQGLTLQWPSNGSQANEAKALGATSQPNLYYTPNLVPPVVWTLVTNTPALSNGQWIVTLPTGTNGSGFYQLQ